MPCDSCAEKADGVQSGRRGDDLELQRIRKKLQSGIVFEFKIHKDGFLRIGNRLCVLNNTELKREILFEAHNSIYIVHIGSTTMYRDLRENF